MPVRAPRAAAAMLAVGTCAAACSADPGPPDPVRRAATATRPAPSGPAPSAAGPGTAPSTTPVRVPLVVAVHPSRTALSLTSEQVRALRAGQVTDWRGFGAVPGPLRAGTLREARRDRSAVALVPATAVGPGVAVARVDGVDPLRRPAAYPVTVPGRRHPRVTTVTVTGDVMLGRRVGERLRLAGDPAAALRPIAARLSSADLTVGNLESTLSTAGAPRQGNDSFAASPSVRGGLRQAGFDVLSLANNHSGDYGPRALVRTVRRLRAGGLHPVGAGADLARAARPVVVERNGVRFGVVAFNAIGETPAARRASPGALQVRMPPRTGPLHRGDLDRLTGIVRTLQDRADVVVVLPHWGAQYTHRAVRAQRTVARALVDAGADVVAGSHPHWVQGVEVVRGGLVAYSLGNLVFDMDFMRQTQEGVLLELVFWGPQLKGARLVPYVIGPDFAPRLARERRGEAILGDVWSALVTSR